MARKRAFLSPFIGEPREQVGSSLAAFDTHVTARLLFEPL